MVQDVYQGEAYHSKEKCFHCLNELWELHPPCHGWGYYCPQCEHLTAPAQELKKRLDNLPPDSIGVVSAVPFKLELVKRR